MYTEGLKWLCGGLTTSSTAHPSDGVYFIGISIKHNIAMLKKETK